MTDADLIAEAKHAAYRIDVEMRGRRERMLTMSKHEALTTAAKFRALAAALERATSKEAIDEAIRARFAWMGPTTTLNGLTRTEVLVALGVAQPGTGE